VNSDKVKIPKDWRRLIRGLRRSGWLIEHTTSGHVKAHPPGGGMHVVMSVNGAPGSRVHASLRRAGWTG
jgi:nicotinamidase-related amidase